LFIDKWPTKSSLHQGREIIAIVPLENGSFCKVLWKFPLNLGPVTVHFFPSQCKSLLYKNFKTLVQCFNE
jgi:hypothetical protein